ncbi:zinc finger protein 638 isoform X2 [Pseudophryne corroboree]|uniref:zinc finger protein 638 isoform X2 n=1 Tax=Pseudophryne corroboree TaxID=495146 RepID=UPI003081A728
MQQNNVTSSGKECVTHCNGLNSQVIPRPMPLDLQQSFVLFLENCAPVVNTLNCGISSPILLSLPHLQLAQIKTQLALHHLTSVTSNSTSAVYALLNQALLKISTAHAMFNRGGFSGQRPMGHSMMNQPGMNHLGMTVAGLNMGGMNLSALNQANMNLSGMNHPGMNHSGMNSGVKQPQMGLPGMNRPNIAFSGMNQPNMTQQRMNQPNMTEQRMNQPNMTQQIMNQPNMTQQRMNQPNMNQLGMNQPNLNQLGMNQPGMNQLAMNQPGMNQLAMNQPGMNQLGMNQLGMNQLGMNQPGMNQPGMNQPGMNQPGMNQPGMNQPAMGLNRINHPGMNQGEMNQGGMGFRSETKNQGFGMRPMDSPGSFGGGNPEPMGMKGMPVRSPMQPPSGRHMGPQAMPQRFPGPNVPSHQGQPRMQSQSQEIPSIVNRMLTHSSDHMIAKPKTPIQEPARPMKDKPWDALSFFGNMGQDIGIKSSPISTLEQRSNPQNRYTNESASSILESFGLSNEDLEELSRYPDDQLTPGNMPSILRDIRLRKMGRPGSTPDQGGGRRPGSEMVPSKVIDYGHSSKYPFTGRPDSERFYDSNKSKPAPKQPAASINKRPEKIPENSMDNKIPTISGSRKPTWQSSKPDRSNNKTLVGKQNIVTPSDINVSQVESPVVRIKTDVPVLPGVTAPVHTEIKLDVPMATRVGNVNYQLPAETTPAGKGSWLPVLSQEETPKPKRLPTPSMMNDYFAASPRIFPHICSLCNVECRHLKDWIKHQNNTSHIENCRKLRQQYPDWNPQVHSSLRNDDKDENTSKRSKSGSTSPRRARRSTSRRRNRASLSRSPRSSVRNRSRSPRRPLPNPRLSRSPYRRTRSPRRSQSPRRPRRGHSRTSSASPDKRAVDAAVQSFIAASKIKSGEKAKPAKAASNVKKIPPKISSVNVRPKKSTSSSAPTKTGSSDAKPPSSNASDVGNSSRKPSGSGSDSAAQKPSSSSSTTKTTTSSSSVVKKPIVSTAAKKTTPTSARKMPPSKPSASARKTSNPPKAPAKSPVAEASNPLNKFTNKNRGGNVIHVTDLPDSGYTDQDILKIIQPFGKVCDVLIVRSKNEAFIETTFKEAASAAVGFSETTPVMINHKRVTLSLVGEKKPVKKESMSGKTSVTHAKNAPPTAKMDKDKPLKEAAVKPEELPPGFVKRYKLADPPLKDSDKCVVAISNLPETQYTVDEVSNLAKPFGGVNDILIIPTHRKAYLELGSKNSVDSMIKFYSVFSTHLGGNLLTISCAPRYKDLKDQDLIFAELIEQAPYKITPTIYEKFVYLHDLPEKEVSEYDIACLGIRFGKVEHYVLFSNKRKAILHMQSARAAKAMHSFMTKYPGNIGGAVVRCSVPSKTKLAEDQYITVLEEKGEEEKKSPKTKGKGIDETEVVTTTEDAPPQITDNKSAPPQITDNKSAPPQITDNKPAPPQITDDKSAPPQITVNKSAPPQITVNKSAPPQITVNKSAPPQITDNKSAPPQITVNKSAPPQITDNKSAPPQITDNKSAPPQITDNKSAPASKKDTATSLPTSPISQTEMEIDVPHKKAAAPKQPDDLSPAKVVPVTVEETPEDDEDYEEEAAEAPEAPESSFIYIQPEPVLQFQEPDPVSHPLIPDDLEVLVSVESDEEEESPPFLNTIPVVPSVRVQQPSIVPPQETKKPDGGDKEGSANKDKYAKTEAGHKPENSVTEQAKNRVPGLPESSQKGEAKPVGKVASSATKAAAEACKETDSVSATSGASLTRTAKYNPQKGDISVTLSMESQKSVVKTDSRKRYSGHDSSNSKSNSNRSSPTDSASSNSKSRTASSLKKNGGKHVSSLQERDLKSTSRSRERDARTNTRKDDRSKGNSSSSRYTRISKTSARGPRSKEDDDESFPFNLDEFVTVDEIVEEHGDSKSRLEGEPKPSHVSGTPRKGKRRENDPISSDNKKSRVMSTDSQELSFVTIDEVGDEEDNMASESTPGPTASSLVTVDKVHAKDRAPRSKKDAQMLMTLDEISDEEEAQEPTTGLRSSALPEILAKDQLVTLDEISGEDEEQTSATEPLNVATQLLQDTELKVEDNGEEPILEGVPVDFEVPHADYSPGNHTKQHLLTLDEEDEDDEFLGDIENRFFTVDEVGEEEEESDVKVKEAKKSKTSTTNKSAQSGNKTSSKSADSSISPATNARRGRPRKRPFPAEGDKQSSQQTSKVTESEKTPIKSKGSQGPAGTIEGSTTPSTQRSDAGDGKSKSSEMLAKKKKMASPGTAGTKLAPSKPSVPTARGPGARNT